MPLTRREFVFAGSAAGAVVAAAVVVPIGLVLTDDRRIQGLYVGTAALALFGVVT